MQCINPIYLASQQVLVPCGRCVGCKMSKSREWSLRMIHEMSYHKGSVFLTLTYSDDYLPADLSLKKADFQRFIKRLRRRFDDRPIMYYGCGEYGELNGRPHYHAIIFGLQFDDLKLSKHSKTILTSAVLSQLWTFGYNTVGTATIQSARYVCDYMHKNTTAEDNVVYINDQPTLRLPPFNLMSQGIGKQFALDNCDQIKQNMTLTLNGKPVGIPKYYQKILDLDKDLIMKKAIERNKETFDYLCDRANRHNSGYFDEKNSAKKQHEKNLNAKKNIKTKGSF